MVGCGGERGPVPVCDTLPNINPGYFYESENPTFCKWRSILQQGQQFMAIKCVGLMPFCQPEAIFKAIRNSEKNEPNDGFGLICR